MDVWIVTGKDQSTLMLTAFFPSENLENASEKSDSRFSGGHH